MITVSIETSSPKAIDFARKLMASKRQSQKEMQAFAKTSEFQDIITELEKKNGR